MLTARLSISPIVLSHARQPPIGDEVRRHVDMLWAQAVADQPDLFDGPVSHVVDIENDTIAIGATTYRYVLAARHDPDLAASLNIRPLAVSGILSCRNGFVLGRRSAVSYGAGLLELVPSGGVMPRPDGSVPNPEEEILRELIEETGLQAHQVKVRAAIGLLEDKPNGTVDILVPLQTDLSAEEVCAIHRSAGSDEYDRLQFYEPGRDSGELPSNLLPETQVIIETIIPKLTRRLSP